MLSETVSRGRRIRLEIIDNPHLHFRISGKGRRFLKAYESLKALME